MARDRLAALLPVYERVLGSEDPETLTVRTELAYWTGESGDAARARDQLAALVPVCQRVLGAEHPDTLALLSSVAYWTAQTGDAKGAREQYVELLAVRERIVGPDHPDTLATRHRLAYWTAQAGDAAGARDQFAELLSAREEVLGPEHPDTLATRDSLAQLTDESSARRSHRGWFRRAGPAQSGLQVAAPGLLPLDRLEQRLEVAFAEPLRAVPLDQLEEAIGLAYTGYVKYLQQIVDLRPRSTQDVQVRAARRCARPSRWRYGHGITWYDRDLQSGPSQAFQFGGRGAGHLGRHQHLREGHQDLRQGNAGIGSPPCDCSLFRAIGRVR